MAVKVRLARFGAKGRPFYRIVAADERSPRDGAFLEVLGTYDPSKKPESVVIKSERVSFWLSKGAQPSQTVGELIKRHVPKA
ncbi:MAG: 30S ribosomal protein S16 [Myxococcota bacterium]|jgi:small subunit ribosomal protein S16|nr:30S ribosomal protein S16 [Myxococcota bacterium]